MTPFQQWRSYDQSRYTLLSNYDRSIRRQNLLMNLVSLFGITLTIALLVVSWDSSIGYWGARQTATEFSLKLCISLSTALLLVLIVRYYLYQLRYEARSWMIIDSLSWCKKRWVFLAVELVVCGIHSFPDGLPGREHRLYDNTFAAFVIFRLYLVIRVIRDFCPVYIQRAGIIASTPKGSQGNPEFNWVLTLRYFFLHYMWIGVISGLGLSLLIFGFGAWVLERTVQPHWSFGIGMWCAMTTMTTVGYGDYYPTWAGSRACMALCALAGIVLTSLLIFVVVQKLDYTHVERRAYSRYKLHGISIRQRKVAARYLQFVWRWYLHRRDYEKSTPAQRENMYKAYVLKTRKFHTKLRHYRSQQSLIIGDLRREEIYNDDEFEDDADLLQDPSASASSAANQEPALMNPAELIVRGRGRRGALFGSISIKNPSLGGLVAYEGLDRIKSVELQLQQLRDGLASVQEGQDILMRKVMMMMATPSVSEESEEEEEGGEGEGGDDDDHQSQSAPVSRGSSSGGIKEDDQEEEEERERAKMALMAARGRRGTSAGVNQVQVEMQSFPPMNPFRRQSSAVKKPSGLRASTTAT